MDEAKEKSKKQHGSKFEHSAGGVVYREKDGSLEILLLKDKNGTWSFPKGLIEDNEAAAKAAEREIEEEVGLANLTFVAAIDSIRYFYRFESRLISKKVDFFLFRYTGNVKPVPQVEEGISEVVWFPAEVALEKIGYEKTNKPILKKAVEMIKAGSI